jgi:hypothetical protein
MISFNLLLLFSKNIGEHTKKVNRKYEEVKDLNIRKHSLMSVLIVCSHCFVRVKNVQFSSGSFFT